MASALFLGLERLPSLSFGLGTGVRRERQLRSKAARAGAGLAALGRGCAHPPTKARTARTRAHAAITRLGSSRESLAAGCRPVTVVNVKIQFAACLRAARATWRAVAARVTTTSNAHAGNAACADDCAASGSNGLPGGESGTNAASGGRPGNGSGGAAPGRRRIGDGRDGRVYGPKYFRFGDNPGFYGSGIDRRESAQMSVAAGASSLRTTLPEYYLQKWGDAIEVEDYASYQPLGLGHHVCFLIGPSHEHSNAPADAQDYELAHYSPKNLYEPIFTRRQRESRTTTGRRTSSAWPKPTASTWTCTRSGTSPTKWAAIGKRPRPGTKRRRTPKI